MFIYCHAELSSKLLRLWVGPWWTSMLLGGFNTSEKYESQLGLLIIPTIWENKNVPNHQPGIVTVTINHSYPGYPGYSH